MKALSTVDRNALCSLRQALNRRRFDRHRSTNFEPGALRTWCILSFIAWIIVLPVHGWAQDNRIVYVVATGKFRGNEIYTMAADGTDRKQLTNNEVLNFDPVWSPDGNRIAFASRMEGGPLNSFDIFVMDTDGKHFVNLTQNPRGDDRMPTWSPDGRKIAFVSGREPHRLDWEIYVMDADGKNIKRLTNNRGSDRMPAWSPDGRWIAYVSEANENGNDDIYVMSPDGRNRKKLTNQIPDAHVPSWSPDGKRIAFACHFNSDICVMDVDRVLNGNQGPINEQDVTNLTKHIAFDYAPTWSPNGDRIAFSSSREKIGAIYVMDADGENVVRLTDELSSSQPDWARPSGFSVSPRKLVTTWGAIKAEKSEKK